MKRALFLLGLVLPLCTALYVVPAWPQDEAAEHVKTVKKLLDDTRRHADDLVKRQYELIKSLGSITPEAAGAVLDELISLMDKRIKAHDEGSEVWKTYDRLGVLIGGWLDDARKHAAAAKDTRWLPIVKMWEERQRTVRQLQMALQHDLAAARARRDHLIEDKEILMSVLKLGGPSAKLMIEKLAKDYVTIQGDRTEPPQLMGKQP
jgi:hypothetical protein